MLAQVLGKLDAYLGGNLPHEELEGWVVSNLQDILSSGDRRAINLANKLDVDFILWGNGELTDTEFDQHLGQLQTQYARPSRHPVKEPVLR